MQKALVAKPKNRVEWHTHVLAHPLKLNLNMWEMKLVSSLYMIVYSAFITWANQKRRKKVESPFILYISMYQHDRQYIVALYWLRLVSYPHI